MSDQEMEMMDQENQEGQIEEAKKASMGDPSEIPDPEAKDAKAPGGDGKMIDKTPKPQGSSNIKAPTTKVGMIAAMNDKMKKMKKDDVKKLYASYNEGTEIEETEEVSSIREIQHISSSDIDVSEDITAIFGGEELTEDFVEKASTIFEAAVVSKVNEILESVTVDLEAELESEKEEIVESISAKLDDYLEYVAEEWMKENELAVEQGIKSEIVENFMIGLRNLFAENYIDIPEEKVDLVDELASKVAELEESLNSELEKNVELHKEISESKKESVLRNVCEGLTESQSEKMKSLSEGVDFDSAEDYVSKLETIKENYFRSEEEETTLTESYVIDEEPVDIDESTETQVDPGMRSYMNAISRSIKK